MGTYFYFQFLCKRNRLSQIQNLKTTNGSKYYQKFSLRHCKVHVIDFPFLAPIMNVKDRKSKNITLFSKQKLATSRGCIIILLIPKGGNARYKVQYMSCNHD